MTAPTAVTAPTGATGLTAVTVPTGATVPTAGTGARVPLEPRAVPVRAARVPAVLVRVLEVRAQALPLVTAVRARPLPGPAVRVPAR